MLQDPNPFQPTNIIPVLLTPVGISFVFTLAIVVIGLYVSEIQKKVAIGLLISGSVLCFSSILFSISVYFIWSGCILAIGGIIISASYYQQMHKMNDTQ